MNATRFSIELERAPHQATRAVIDAMGGEAPRMLYRSYDAFNARFFDGALGAPLILITHTSSSRALADYAGRDVHGIRSMIRIAPKVMKSGELFAVDVLLHEMTHMYADEVVGDPEPGYCGHGPTFARKCNEVGQMLGLPPVGVRRRGGLPDCAGWPMVVRPQGYYGVIIPKVRKWGNKAGVASQKGVDHRAPREDEIRRALIKGARLVGNIVPSEREALELSVWLAEVRALLAETA